MKPFETEQIVMLVIFAVGAIGCLVWLLVTDFRDLQDQLGESNRERWKFSDKVEEQEAEIDRLKETLETYRKTILSARSERPEYRDKFCCDLMPAGK